MNLLTAVQNEISSIDKTADEIETELLELKKEKEDLGKLLIENHITPMSILKKIMYLKMKMYFDHDFLEQNMFLRFLIFEPDRTFAECFAHLFTKEEFNLTSMFNKEVLKNYLLTIKMNNDEFAFLQGPVNTDKQVRASKMATFTGTDNPYMVLRENCTAKEYKSYKRRMLENKEIEKFLD